MAKPLSASQLLKALKDEGVDVREYRSWRTHNRNHRGAWGPVNGIVIHHTAGRDSLSLVYNGTSALPGPLCHSHLDKNGVVRMISAGRANHAGSFTQNAHNAVVNESKTHPRPSGAEVVDGNRHYYGIEIENLGDGKDRYPAKQYDAAVRWAAAICRAHGWSEHSIIGHREGTTRKIDPRGPIEGGGQFDMDRFRKDVGARLRGAGKDDDNMPSAKEIAAAVGNRQITIGDSKLKADTFLRRILENAWQDQAKLERLQQQVDRIEQQLAQIADALKR